MFYYKRPEKYRVRWTELAEAGAFEIGEEIMKTSTSAASAAKRLRVLRGGGNSLANFPELGTELPDNKGVFFVVFGNKDNRYKLYYNIDTRDRVVNILYLTKAWRDLKKINP